MSRYRTVKGLFGQQIHYKDGRKVGETWDGLIPGSKVHYNQNGEYVGRSDRGFFADYVHRDLRGSRIGSTWSDDAGIDVHYDDRGYAGATYNDAFGASTYLSDSSHLDNPDDCDSLCDGSSFDW